MTSTPVRLDAAPANDNSNPLVTSGPVSRPRETGPEVADLASGDVRLPSPDPGAPTVSVSADRAEQAYACSGNLILPLRFARRFPGWTTSRAGR